MGTYNQKRDPAPQSFEESEFQNLFQKTWIQDKLDTESIDFADKLGKHLSQGKELPVTKTQIRGFFGEVKRIQAMPKPQQKAHILLLRPLLAYQTKRHATDKNPWQVFRSILDTALKSIYEGNPGEADTLKRFQNFVDFLESLLAYSRYYDKSPH